MRAPEQNDRSVALAAVIPALVFVAFFLAPRPVVSSGQEHPSWEIPETREENLQLAEDYRQRAAQLRLDAALHRAMKASYAQALSQRPTSAVKRWWSKQRRHCEQLIRSTESLAADMESLSQFYAARAAEPEKD